MACSLGTCIIIEIGRSQNTYPCKIWLLLYYSPSSCSVSRPCLKKEWIDDERNNLHIMMTSKCPCLRFFRRWTGSVVTISVECHHISKNHTSHYHQLHGFCEIFPSTLWGLYPTRYSTKDLHMSRLNALSKAHPPHMNLYRPIEFISLHDLIGQRKKPSQPTPERHIQDPPWHHQTSSCRALAKFTCSMIPLSAYQDTFML